MVLFSDLLAFVQIVLIDVSLAGDNAVTVALAASGLKPDQRKKAMAIGILGATVLRVLFAVFAVKLLHVKGLMLAGGMLLAWIAIALFLDLRRRHRVALGDPSSSSKRNVPETKSLRSAVGQIMLADLSMSLDNVLAVAGVARNHMIVLILGLVLSVCLMGVASAFLSRVLLRYIWIEYLGLIIIFYTACAMTFDGGEDLMTTFGGAGVLWENMRAIF